MYKVLMAKKKPETFTPDQLRALRARLDLTQAEAAEKVGVSRRAWASWEGEEKTPARRTVILIRLLSQGKL